MLWKLQPKNYRDTEQESAVLDRKWVSKQLDGHQSFYNYMIVLTDILKELDIFLGMF